MFSETFLHLWSFGVFLFVFFCFYLESSCIIRVIPLVICFPFPVCFRSFPPLIIFVIVAVSHVHIFFSLGLHSDIPLLRCSVSLIFINLTRSSGL